MENTFDHAGTWWPVKLLEQTEEKLKKLEINTACKARTINFHLENKDELMEPENLLNALKAYISHKLKIERDRRKVLNIQLAQPNRHIKQGKQSEC